MSDRADFLAGIAASGCGSLVGIEGDEFGSFLYPYPDPSPPGRYFDDDPYDIYADDSFSENNFFPDDELSLNIHRSAKRLSKSAKSDTASKSPTQHETNGNLSSNDHNDLSNKELSEQILPNLKNLAVFSKMQTGRNSKKENKHLAWASEYMTEAELAEYNELFKTSRKTELWRLLGLGERKKLSGRRFRMTPEGKAEVASKKMVTALLALCHKRRGDDESVQRQFHAEIGAELNPYELFIFVAQLFKSQLEWRYKDAQLANSGEDDTKSAPKKEPDAAANRDDRPSKKLAEILRLTNVKRHYKDAQRVKSGDENTKKASEKEYGAAAKRGDKPGEILKITKMKFMMGQESDSEFQEWLRSQMTADQLKTYQKRLVKHKPKWAKQNAKRRHDKRVQFEALKDN